jgi:5'-nucleotidase (lipoprotein e(P4) family)
MKKSFLVLLAVTVIACRHQQPVAIVPAERPAPVVTDPQHLLSQQNVDATIYQNASAEGARLYEQCYELARMRLDANLARPHDKPAAVIVDVDETVLDNSPSNVTDIVHGRTWNKENWYEWTTRASAQALPGAIDFLRYAVTQGCEVYYITNRATNEKNATIKNLFELGFPLADEAHVMTMENGVSDKTDRRALVAKKHYVALLCGDQLTDFDQRFKDRSTELGLPTVKAMHDTLSRYFVLLPNPIYGTWLDAAAGRVDSLKLERKAAFLQQRAY